jgi:hypothetical protein
MSTGLGSTRFHTKAPRIVILFTFESRKQEVLRRINILLSFHMSRTAKKTTRQPIYITFGINMKIYIVHT